MVLYVSYMYDIYNRGINPLYIENAQYILNSDIDILVFTDQIYYDELTRLGYDVAKFYVLDISTLSTYQLIHNKIDKLSVSTDDNPSKNSLGFMSMINLKIELIKEASKIYDHSHYIWIDLGIFKVFSVKDNIWLNKLSEKDLSKIDKIVMPGCYYTPANIERLCGNVYWMMLGGLYICPKECIDSFFDLNRQSIQKFLDLNVLTWEVNIWADIECNYPGYFDWYYADHNDLIYINLFPHLDLKDIL